MARFVRAQHIRTGDTVQVAGDSYVVESIVPAPRPDGSAPFEYRAELRHRADGYRVVRVLSDDLVGYRVTRTAARTRFPLGAWLGRALATWLDRPLGRRGQ